MQKNLNRPHCQSVGLFIGMSNQLLRKTLFTQTSNNPVASIAQKATSICKNHEALA